MQARRPSTLVLPALLAFGVLVSCSGQRHDDDPPPPPPPPSLPVTDLDVGLTPEEATAWRFTSEGSDLVPVDLLRALIDVSTGQPFSESLARYGFLPSPAGPANPYGLAVGWTVDVPDFAPAKLDFVGLNCSACHTGQIEYGGQALRIDGGPNMADIEAFGLAVKDSALHMVEHPTEAFLFVWRLTHLDPPAGARAAATPAQQLDNEYRRPDGRLLLAVLHV